MCYTNGFVDIRYLLGLLNSKVASEALSVLSPTLDFHEGPMSKVPVIFSKENFKVSSSFHGLISISSLLNSLSFVLRF